MEISPQFLQQRSIFILFVYYRTDIVQENVQRADTNILVMQFSLLHETTEAIFKKVLNTINH